MILGDMRLQYIFTQLKYSIMGNQICIIEETRDSIQCLNKGSNAQHGSINFKEKDAEINGHENFQLTDLEEMDQCLPLSKLDKNFLRSSVKASNLKLTDVQFSKSFQPHYGKILRPFLQSKNEIKKILQQLSTKNFGRKQTCENFQATKEKSQKLSAIKMYANYISQKSTQFLKIKISGQNFYKLRNQSIKPYYSISNKIGQGSFGSVFKGKCLKTGEIRAIKILKKKIMNQKDQQSLLSQINILKRLDHINIIKLYDVFFHNNFFYVVTQYCKGGSLLSALQKQQIKSQKHIAIIMKQLFSAISYMHHLNIAHRDLKLENIVFVSPINSSKSNTCIKLIDFGLAQVVQNKHRNSTGLVGSFSYMAPQIFEGYYNLKSDVWSCGIIMCMLLIGYNPFKKNKQILTVKAIKQSEINYKSSQWSKISARAKKLLPLMLNKCLQTRIQIDQALNDQWIKFFIRKQLIQSLQADYKSELVINNFNNYHRSNNFMCYIKNYFISRQLTQVYRQQMALIFEKIDTDSSGVIQKQELKQLYSLVTGITNEQIQMLIQKIDQNNSGKIDFHQFLLCMMKDEIVQSRQCINQAFDFFDEDHTGYIQRKQLFDCLEGCQQELIIGVLKDADFNGDGKISREEFANYLLKIQT